MLSHPLKLQIKNEYNILSHIQKELTLTTSQFKTSLFPHNKSKNRYNSVLTLESTRVKLACSSCNHLNPECEHSDDYVNANYVSSFYKENEYIATQAPLGSTCAAFWNMVWQDKVMLVMMLTLIEENGISKCYPYFPEAGQQPLVFGDFIVAFNSSFTQNGIIVRELVLKHTKYNEMRRIFHAQVSDWPDQCVPEGNEEDIFALIHLLANIRKVQSSPVLVHCSAGIGRTGTLLAIFNCLHSISEIGNCDVAKIVQKIREERFGSVMNFEQYEFIYKVIVAYTSRFGLNNSL